MSEQTARLLAPLELAGLNIVVHAAPEFGATAADAAAICQALLDCVGPHGTIVMPAFTYTRTLLVPGATPVPFHSDLPVSEDVGAVAEAFRKLPAVLRSSHPSHSFTAIGRQAGLVLSTQRDNNPLGPIKKLNVMRGHVLLLGTTLRDCTALHLAEETAPLPYLGRGSAVRINVGGYQERVVVEQVPGCSAAFDRLEERLDPTQVVSTALPQGLARKIPIRYLVRLAAAALANDPAALICERADCPSCTVKRAAVRDSSHAA